MSGSIAGSSTKSILSILGPLLFLLHINDLTRIVYGNCEIRLFADDALIYKIGHISQEINDNLNIQMLNIQMQKIEMVEK